MKAGYKKLTMALIALGFASFFTEEASGQNFDNGTTGTYNATCGAVIKIKSVTGTITEGSEGLGTSAKPIPGVVDWARNVAATTQTVTAYYYDNLVLSGASLKTVQDGVFVMGASCPSYLAGYTQLGTYPYYVAAGTGTVTYTNTFNYAGTTDQNIFPQTNYVTLSVTGAGNATVLASETVTTQNLTSAGGAPIVVAGTLNLSGGPGPVYLASDLNGAVSVSAGGTLTTGAGDVTIDGDLASAGTITTGAGDVDITSTFALTGTGTMTTGAGDVVVSGATTTADGTTITVGAGDLTFSSTLALAGDLVNPGGVVGTTGDVIISGATAIASTGTLDFGDNANLLISGTISNAGTGANLLFNCGSNVRYNSATAGQVVMATGIGSYGNLFLSGADKVGGEGGPGPLYYNVDICGNFNLADGNFDMYKGGTNSGTFTMTNASKTATYLASAEVIGRMRRNYDAATVAYTFNNTNTTVNFTTDATSGSYFALDVRPGEAPINTLENTVDRRIIPDFDLAGFATTIKVAYLSSELPTFTGGLTESNLKFFEADGPLAGNIEKVSGSITRDLVPTLRWVSVAGIQAGTGAVDGVVENLFTSSHDLVLRANNTMYTIANGRWTNPATWDEGTVPTENDNAEIRNTVYVGIDGPFAGTLALGNTTSEHAYYATLPAADGDVPAANTITIANKIAGPATPFPALIIGNEDNPDSYVFKTKATGTSFTNNNTNAGTFGFPIDLTAGSGKEKSDVVLGSIQGLWITPYTTVSATPGVQKVPAFGTNSIDNKGSINNQGIIEIGE